MTTDGGEDQTDGRLHFSVVVPAHNEEEYLPAAARTMLDGLRGRAEPFEIIICENGSSDRTAEVADGIAAAPEVRVIRLPAADYGQALRAGFLAARGEFVVNFDVDLVDLTFLDQAAAVARADDAVAVVVGTKRGPGAEDERALGRRAVTGVFSLLLRAGFGLGVSDTHGLKLLRHEPLLPLVEACRSGSDIFDTELVLRAERAALGVEEVPVHIVDQRPPRTSVAARIPRTLLGLARLRILLWREARSSWSGGPGGGSSAPP